MIIKSCDGGERCTGSGHDGQVAAGPETAASGRHRAGDGCSRCHGSRGGRSCGHGDTGNCGGHLVSGSGCRWLGVAVVMSVISRRRSVGQQEQRHTVSSSCTGQNSAGCQRRDGGIVPHDHQTRRPRSAPRLSEGCPPKGAFRHAGGATRRWGLWRYGLARARL
eukprot:364217-Chlamydomonas_euryale.AAC.1